MERTTGSLVDTFEADNLVAKLSPPAELFLVTLTTAGAYERGTVLSRETDGTYEVLGSGSGTASAVIAEDTLETDTTAQAYRTGHFYRNALIAADEYELTEEDENNLRLAGILLSDGV